MYVYIYVVYVIGMYHVGDCVGVAVCLKSGVYFGLANCHLSFINNEEKCRWVESVFLEATLIFH